MIRIEEGHKLSQKRGNKYVWRARYSLCRGRNFFWSLEAFIETQEEINRKYFDMKKYKS
jgi:hypothetical protein